MPVIGSPIDSGPSSSLHVRQAVVPNIFGEDAKGRKLAVHTIAGVSGAISLPIYDEFGNPLEPIIGGQIKYRIAEAVKKDVSLYEGTDISFDTATSKATLNPPKEITDSPGIYDISVGLFDETETLKFVRNFYVYNEPSSWGNATTSALPSLDSIRIHLRDSDLVENELLGSYQYGLEEICAAIVRTVEYWNSTPPLTASDTRNFSHPAILHAGLEVHLFEILLEWYRKNRLPYSAGGVNVDDMSKLNEYMVAAQGRKQELVRLIQRIKTSENLRSAFARIG